MKKTFWMAALLGVALLFCACSAKPQAVLDKTQLTLKTGARETLTLTGAEGDLTWSSSDETVVTVEGEGETVEAVARGVGSAEITVTCGDETIATCSVTVEKSTLSVFLPENPNLLVLKRNMTATVKAYSETALSEDPVWESSDPSIATVEYQGLTARVTAVARGECEITVRCGEEAASFRLCVGVS